MGKKQELTDELLHGMLVPQYASETEIVAASAIIALPFNSYLANEKPDASNVEIAYIANDYRASFGLPFYGQREQTALMRPDTDMVHQFASCSGEHVESQRLIRWQAQEILAAGEGNRVIVIGMPEHLGRVTALMSYYGLIPVPAPECVKIPYDSSVRPGYQKWCVSRERFVRYERRWARPGTVAKLWLGMM